MNAQLKNLIKRIPALLCVAFIACLLLPYQVSFAADYGDHLIDDEGYLSDDDYYRLMSALEQVSDKYNVDVVAYLDDSLYGKTPQQLADDTYDSNGYRQDGILFMINFEDNDWAISTKGYGITAFTDAGQSYMMGQIRPYLSKGDYAGAISTYANLADDLLYQAKSGHPYDVNSGNGDVGKGRFKAFRNILIAVFGGFIVSLIRVSGMKAETKTVHKTLEANSYLVGNVALSRSEEFFKGSEFRPIPQPSSGGGGGGSTTHVSSSGSVHGGSSGKF